MDRKTALRQINEESVERLAKAIRKLWENNTSKFSARDISELTEGYVSAESIKESIKNDIHWTNYRRFPRTTLVGRAFIKTGLSLKFKTDGYKYVTVRYVNVDDERDFFEKEEAVTLYSFCH